MMSAEVGLLLGFLLGILASIFAGVRLSFHQFRYSTAGYRVDMVAEATSRLVRLKDGQAKDMSTGMLRDKYRYSLGVILDELVQTFHNSEFAADGPWPLTIDIVDETKGNENSECTYQGSDRWGRFNNYIRPVMTDINVYVFVARFPRPFDWIYDKRLVRRLGNLAELCQQLETVVGELDAAMDANPAAIRSDGRAIYPNDSTNTPRLVEEHKRLFDVWNEWKNLIIAEEQV